MLKLLKNISPSKITLWCLLIIMLWTFFNLKRWDFSETRQKIIMWDVTSYYSYLPAAFIHHDVTLEFTRRGTDKNYEENHQFWYQTAPNGSRVIKTTMGMAILYSPFFFIANMVVHLSNYTPNGFSKPYEFFLALSSICYLFLGLIFLRKLLLLFYNEIITSITLVCILLGTNLYYYTTTEPAMSHAYSFSLIAVLLYQFIKWYSFPTFTKAILIGLLLGLIILIRPINIIIILFLLFYDVYSKQSLINKFQFTLKYWKQIFIIAFFSFLIFLPQLIYWKYLTGSWVFNSYLDEKFYFNNPHVLLGLFSFRNGWLIYTPIMFFAIVGVINLFFKEKKIFLPILIYLPINAFILYSWWTWWYGGSFGSRPMIDSYAIFALPMASFINLFFTKSKLIFTILILILILLISLNQFQTFQRRNGIIHWDKMTAKAYAKIFFKTELSHDDIIEYEKLLQQPDYDKARIGEDE